MESAVLTQPGMDKPPLRARMLNEFAYCLRLCYLEWVQRQFAENVGSDCLDGHKFLESPEIGRISGVQRKAVRRGGRGDEQVGEAWTSGPSCRARCCEYSAVHARGFCIKRQRVPGRSDPLQPVLAPRTLLSIGCRMGSGGKLGEGDGGNGGFVRKMLGSDGGDVDQDRCIQQTASRLSHRRIGL